ncbi:hypothetical protein [Streptomyces sp. NPDC088348]|uniref:hypothetical protein n=1 Tax=Streptomyces sp. NPDC088348 TaxID=3365853 RepID=UPI003805908D
MSEKKASGAAAPHADPPRTRGGESGGGRTSGNGEDAARDAGLWADLLIRQFPDLLDELAPSAGSRPTAVRHVSGPAERAARAAATAAERAEALRNEQQHGLTVPGHTAAPVRLHISDALRDITDGVVELEEALFDRLGMGRPRRAPVPERLARVAALLGRTATDPSLAGHARDELRRMARRCSRALGETETMARLSGRCPWCDSVSLRAFPDRDAVLCVNPGCRCGDAECDCATDPAFRHLWERDAWAAVEAARTGVEDSAVPAGGGHR